MAWEEEADRPASPNNQPTKQFGRAVQCEVLADDAIKFRFPGPHVAARARLVRGSLTESRCTKSSLVGPVDL